MTTSLYQIFYPYNKFDTIEKINILKKYMYQGSVIKDAEVSLVVPVVEDTKNNPLPIYYPEKQNSLFWCIYIFVYGEDEYQMIQPSKQSTIELSENQKIINFIRSNPKILKSTNHKITNLKMQEILSDLMIGKKNNLSLLLAYSVFHKLSIIIFHENLYLEILPQDHSEDSRIYIQYDDKLKRYGIKSIETIDNGWQETFFKIENYNKPLKAISNYKVGDLKEIANKIGVDIGSITTVGTALKQQIYLILENKFLILLKNWMN